MSNSAMSLMLKEAIIMVVVDGSKLDCIRLEPDGTLSVMRNDRKGSILKVSGPVVVRLAKDVLMRLCGVDDVEYSKPYLHCSPLHSSLRKFDKKVINSAFFRMFEWNDDSRSLIRISAEGKPVATEECLECVYG